MNLLQKESCQTESKKANLNESGEQARMKRKRKRTGRRKMQTKRKRRRKKRRRKEAAGSREILRKGSVGAGRSGEARAGRRGEICDADKSPRYWKGGTKTCASEFESAARG